MLRASRAVPSVCAIGVNKCDLHLLVWRQDPWQSERREEASQRNKPTKNDQSSPRRRKIGEQPANPSYPFFGPAVRLVFVRGCSGEFFAII